MSIADNIKELKNMLPQGVSLVAVSKFHPSQDIAQAYEAGQRIFAESRPQELLKKVQELPEKDFPGIEWHFIGHLQSNKLKMVLPYVSLVQSVDSVKLLDEIQAWAAKNSKVIDVLLEYHVAMEESKQGFYEEEIVELLFRAENYKNIRFRGLMAMASNTEEEAVVDADFERVDSLMAYLVDLFPELEDFNQLSIGMSFDWPLAVKHGSTMVRIGTAIFGERKNFSKN